MQNCINAAITENQNVWIPPGTYYVLNTETLYLSNNITIQGAGPWYSKVVCTKSGGHLFECQGASIKDLCVNSTGTTATPGIYAVRAYGGSWVIDDVWCKHMTLLWGGGTNDALQNCRVNNSCRATAFNSTMAGRPAPMFWSITILSVAVAMTPLPSLLQSRTCHQCGTPP